MTTSPSTPPASGQPRNIAPQILNEATQAHEFSAQAAQNSQKLLELMTPESDQADPLNVLMDILKGIADANAQIISMLGFINRQNAANQELIKMLLAERSRSGNS